jgi:hypothetical protein
MKKTSYILFVLIFGTTPLFSQYEAIKTPLKQEVLTLLTNEISGQFIFNNEVLLAGAPWIRGEDEFTDTFYESKKIHELVRNYGIKTTELIRSESNRTFDYPFEGEFWITEPEKRLIARLGADAALVAGGSQTADITGELVYIPPSSDINQILGKWRLSGKDSSYVVTCKGRSGAGTRQGRYTGCYFIQ